MATRLPGILPRRPTTTALPLISPASHTPLSRTPSRAATLIRRPRRPYTFTQLVQLSDGSTYTMRTSSPLGMYKSTKDTRNHPLWLPNDKSLQNVEVDEAGKLAAFRERFGRGWDSAEDPSSGGSAAAGKAADKATGGSGDAFADLIAGYAANMPETPTSSKPPREKKK